MVNYFLLLATSNTRLRPDNATGIRHARKSGWASRHRILSLGRSLHHLYSGLGNQLVDLNRMHHVVRI